MKTLDLRNKEMEAYQKISSSLRQAGSDKSVRGSIIN